MKHPCPGIYEHYKGRRYRVHCLARHSETAEELVVYETLYENPEGKMWIRPRNMFIENVLVDGKEIPRFRLISSSDPGENSGF